MDDLISRQSAIDALGEKPLAWTEGEYELGLQNQWQSDVDALKALPSAQPERLTDDDFEAIRIHLNAFKEDLCNQGRWKEAEDYERLIDRFMSFASAQPERKKGRWIKMSDADGPYYCCSECGEELYRKCTFDREFDLFPKKESVEKTMYCPNCGADMRGEQDG